MRIYGIRFENCQSFKEPTIIPLNPYCTIIDGINDNGKSAISKAAAVFAKPYSVDEYLALVNFDVNNAEIQIFTEDYYSLKCTITILPKRATPVVMFYYLHGVTEVRRWDAWCPEIAQLLSWLTITSKTNNHYSMNFKKSAMNLFIDTEPDVSTFVIDGICVDEEEEIRIANLNLLVDEFKLAIKDYKSDMEFYRNKMNEHYYRPIDEICLVRESLATASDLLLKIGYLEVYSKTLLKIRLIQWLKKLYQTNFIASYDKDCMRHLLLKDYRSSYARQYLLGIAKTKSSQLYLYKLLDNYKYNYLLSYIDILQKQHTLQVKQLLLHKIRAKCEILGQYQDYLSYSIDFRKFKSTQEIQLKFKILQWQETLSAHLFSLLKTHIKRQINLSFRSVLGLKELQNTGFSLYKKAIMSHIKNYEMQLQQRQVLLYYAKTLYKLQLLKQIVNSQKENYTLYYVEQLYAYKVEEKRLILLKQTSLLTKHIKGMQLLAIMACIKETSHYNYLLQYANSLKEVRQLERGICPTCGQVLQQEGVSHLHDRLS